MALHTTRQLRHAESTGSSASTSSGSYHKSTSVSFDPNSSRSVAPPPLPLGLEANALCHRSHWVPKSTRSTCACCERPFRLWTKKHHCRLCGDVVCRTCSTQRILIHKKTLRSCDACMSVSVQRVSELSRRNSLGDLGAEASAAAAAMALTGGRKSDGALLRRSMSLQRSASSSTTTGPGNNSKRLSPRRRSLSRRESGLTSRSATESALHALRRRYRAQLPYVVFVFLLTLAGVSNLLSRRA